MRGGGEGMIRMADLANSPDRLIGGARVSPAARTIAGPLREVTVEPRVMQVLLALAEAEGAVVTRARLELRCWGGPFASEDSLNRAIAALRRALRDAGAGDLAVETIPRTGYRLRLRQDAAPAADHGEVRSPVRALGRRAFVAGAGAAALAAAGALGWRLTRSGADGRVDQLLAEGRDVWRLGLPGDSRGIAALERATALAPGRADAWGLLALLERNRVEYADGAEVTEATTRCQEAARRALALDPRQGDALAALAALPPLFGDWIAARRRYTAVIRVAPDNAAALSLMSFLEMSTGRPHVSQGIIDRLLAADPLAAVQQHKHVYLLWTAGRLDEMDRAADRALELWPTHPAIWYARFWTLAFTGRAQAAAAMLAERGRNMAPPSFQQVLRATLAALTAPGDAALLGAAVAANRAAAVQSPPGAVAATMSLSALGAADDSLAVARGFLARRGPLIAPVRAVAGQLEVNDQRRRMTMMLWIPASARLRAHPGFSALMEEIGLARAWRVTGLGPDYLAT
jgi:DNA-binding winged helix-turn-helix (wHTH) protein